MMGGIGSGRRPTGKVRTVEASRRLDLGTIKQAIQRHGSPVCTVTWSTGAVSTTAVVVLLADRLIVWCGDQTLQAAVTSRPGRLGGRLHALLCPGCARERHTLYLDSQLQCRQCAGLLYQSQLCRSAGRAGQRAAKIINLLGADSTGTVAMAMRPKHMHRSRYLALVRQLATAYATLRSRLQEQRACVGS